LQSGKALKNCWEVLSKSVIGQSKLLEIPQSGP
jgi:hypothetical protein